MKKSNKRIAWITASAFLDTDIYIVPLLMKELSIDWYIIKHDNEKTDYDDEVNDLVLKSKHVKVILCARKAIHFNEFSNIKSFFL